MGDLEKLESRYRQLREEAIARQLTDPSPLSAADLQGLRIVAELLQEARNFAALAEKGLDRIGQTGFLF